MARGKWFWNLISGMYASQKIADEAAYQHKLEKTRALFDGTETVLEIGCGTGTTAVSHAPHVAEITGLDYSEKMIAIAQKRAKDADVANAKFVVESIATMAKDAQYDVVMAHSILHLMPTWKTDIRTCFELTKPGGYFVSSTTCIGDGNAILNGILKVAKATRLVPPMQFFTKQDLFQEMASAGFEITYEYHAGQDGHPGKDGAVFIIAQRPV